MIAQLIQDSITAKNFDQDIAKTLFELLVPQKKSDEGLLSKLAFWRSDKPQVPTGSQYRIYVKGVDSTSTVQVLTREGGMDTSESARKILGLLHQQLK